MEAIAAFGLACNIITVVDASVTAVKLLQQTYEKGSSQENLDINETTSQLTDSVLALDKVLKTSHGAVAKNEVELQLQSLALQCVQSANELSHELQYLKSKGGRLNAVKTVLMSMTKKARIEKLKRKLDQHQTLLNTGLLISLRDRFDTAFMIHQTSFEKLDTSLQGFIQALNKGMVRVEDLIQAQHASLQKATQVENAETRAHITTELQNMRLDTITTLQSRQLIDSLRYNEIFARQNQIAARQGDTFDWIYEKDRTGPWMSFSDWLESGKDVFWIQGKPGSGKSCLMKFILVDARTKTHLRQWRSAGTPRILSFFFWLVGSNLQNGIHGFACSLLHQLLEHNDGCINDLIAAQPNLQQKHNIWDWDTQEALNILLDLVRTDSAQTPFLFLIDGLDEFDQNDDLELLAKTLLALDACQNVKLCISSRPETHITSILNRQPSIRLQDLTAADIRYYVSTRLDEFESTQAVNLRMSNKEHDDLVAEFVSRANGVFLWIRLAMRGAFRGLRRGDTFDQLWLRLSELPTEIEQLYENILSRIGPDLELYKQEASTYLKIACLAENLKLVQGPQYKLVLGSLHYAVAASKYLNHAEAYDQPTAELGNLVEDVDYTNLRIASCCNGLLDVDSDQSADGLDYILGTRVYMAHRSVRDFLLEKPTGKQLLAKSPIDNFAIFCAILEAELVLFNLDKRLSTSFVFFEDLQGFIWKLSSFQETSPSIVDMCKFMRKRLRDYAEPSSATETNDDGQWEYEFCRRLCWRQTDVIGVIAPCVSFEILERLAGLSVQNMSTDYQGYLLFCLSAKPDTQYVLNSTQNLLRSGAKADAQLFLPVTFPVKTTAWSNAFENLYYRTRFRNASDTIERFMTPLLKAGADPEQKFLAVFKVFYFKADLMPLHSVVGLYSGVGDSPGTFLICEVNACFVLSWSERTDLAAEAGVSESIPYVQPLVLWLQHEFDRSVNPSRDNLVMFCPALEIYFDKGEAVNISTADRAILTAIVTNCRKGRNTASPQEIASCQVTQKTASQQKLPSQDPEISNVDVIDTMQRIADSGEKVDIRDVLESYGYYKRPRDPAVFQGPIRRSAMSPIVPHKQDVSKTTELNI